MGASGSIAIEDKRRGQYLCLRQMVTIVFGRRVADIEEGSMETRRVLLGQRDSQAEHARGEAAAVAAVKAEWHGAVLVAEDETRVCRTGPAQREGNEGRKSEQTCCNHVDGVGKGGTRKRRNNGDLQGKRQADSMSDPPL